jgi:broad specificity phosphatase PhoE
MIVFLVRHGETDWNRTGQVMGELPIPLNSKGEQDSKQLASALLRYPIKGVISSPALRTRQTADILASALNISVTTDQRLTEIGVGTWEGRFWKDLSDDLTRQNLYAQPHEVRPPGGETLTEVQDRAVSMIEEVLIDHHADFMLFVSHADVIRTIVAHYLRFELRNIRQVRITHASLTALELKNGLADLVCLNYVPVPIFP